MNEHQLALNRRRFLECFSAGGLALMPGALMAVAQDSPRITREMLEAAQRIAGVSFTLAEEERILARLNGQAGPLRGFDLVRSADLGDTQPAIVFNPVLPGKVLPNERRPLRRRVLEVRMPATDEDLAFLPLTHLAKLVETRQIRPTELTQLYLSRLKRYDPKLLCVVNLTEDLALRQARRADEEIAAGTYRGPLHGIPWGVKDLFAVRGTKTTWGMTPYRNRVIDLDSSVYSRLTEAGAILVAKLSTGALAVTARWFGGLTRNPWNTAQNASGSSAGSGSATAAGLVGFAIGTDTGGSIIGPSSRNGITGLRPTFGRVSRHGAMVLAWTQDTVGPMCRSAEDCAIVLDAIYGPDGKDNTLIRSAYFTPGVDFIQANRFRMRVMEEMDKAMADFDLFIGSQQALTNRTGHPVISMPSGFYAGTPTALHFTGKLFGESEILLLAHAFVLLKRPSL
jgi:Asp-tRNA(Asn)/Glu-tRNA(Gln) amidotransferase A subunit family amidase